KSSTQVMPVDLKQDQGKKLTRQSVELDPRALGLKHGDQLSYVVKVTDTKQNPAQATTEAPAALASNAKAGESSPKEGEQNAKADAEAKESTDPIEKESKENNESKSSQQNASSLAANVAAKKL